MSDRKTPSRIIERKEYETDREREEASLTMTVDQIQRWLCGVRCACLSQRRSAVFGDRKLWLVYAMSALINSDLPGLTLISKGKVRDIYSTSSPDHLLFVATDRISAYDVILKNVSLSTPARIGSHLKSPGNPRQGQTPHQNLPFLVLEAIAYHPEPFRDR